MVLAVGAVAGQEPERPEQEAWTEDAAPVLEELAASGSPATSRELRWLMGEDEERVPWARLSGRLGHKRATGPDTSIRFRATPGRALARFRWRRSAAGERRAFVAGWRGDRFTFLAGRLGMHAGSGFLVGGPGRTPTLTGDRGLVPGPDRLVAWTGEADGRTRRGLGMVLTAGALRLTALAGDEGQDTPRWNPGTAVVRLGWTGGGIRMAAGAARTPEGPGGSIDARVTRGRVTLGGEGCLWPAGVDRAEAWVLRLCARWRPRTGLLVEGAWSAADRDRPWRLGVRGAELPGWHGHGAAGRARLRVSPRTVLRLLYHGGWAEPEARDGERRRRRLWDLEWERDLDGRTEASVRIRSTDTARWTFSARHPWLPPVPVTDRSRSVVSLRVTRRWEAWKAAALVRTLADRNPDGARRRSLLAVSVRFRAAGGWTVRGHAITAWGEDVDLVSAVAPHGGLILTRHWGRWRSEAGVGIERRGRGWTLQVAGGFRRAEPDRGETSYPWLRAGWEVMR